MVTTLPDMSNDTYTVERSIPIDSAPAEIYALVVDFRRVMGIFKSMDALIGPDFEKGLGQLKALVESSPR